MVLEAVLEYMLVEVAHMVVYVQDLAVEVDHMVVMHDGVMAEVPYMTVDGSLYVVVVCDGVAVVDHK